MATSGVLPVANIDVSPPNKLGTKDTEMQINYPEELARIEDFLTRYVADRSTRTRQLPSDDDQEAEEEDAEEQEDDLADAVDDLDVNGERRSKAKYMKVLRKVANRQSAAVIVDLNDVKEVRLSYSRGESSADKVAHPRRVVTGQYHTKY
jgi:hypothetical protein